MQSIDHSDRAAARFAARKADIALLAAAIVVLLLSYGAALAGLADGTIDSRFLWSVDSPRLWLAFEAWLSDEGSFWNTKWSTSNFLFDIAILYPLYLLLGYVGGGLIYPLVTVAIAAAGWVFLCAAVFGKNHRRAAFVIFAHALPLVWMAWFGEDVFLMMLIPVYHFTAWAALPWLLYLAVRILQGGGRGFTAGFGLLSALSVLNDAVSIPWFFAPFAAALFLMFYADNKGGAKRAGTKRRNIGRHKTAFAAMTIGVIAGYLASKTVPFADRLYSGRVFSAPDLGHLIDTIGNLTDWLLIYAKGNPFGALVWLAFAVVAGRGFMAALSPAFGPASLPVGRRMLFLFAPLSMAATAAAVIASGLFPFASIESFLAAGGVDAGGKRYVELLPPAQASAITTRYILPLLFFPLYAGWAVYLPALRAPVMGAALLTIAALAIPRAAELDWRRLDPYAHPFYACIHKAAERLDSKGIMTSSFGNEIYGYPNWRWRAYSTIGALYGGQGYLYTDQTFPYRMKQASFDFVVANAAGGKVSFGTPGRPPLVCDYDKWHRCIAQTHQTSILSGQAIRGAFGEPREVIQCPGNAAIYYYDPPIVVRDFHGLKRVGETFDTHGWAMPADK